MTHALRPYREYRDSGVPWLRRIPAHWTIGPGFSTFREKKVNFPHYLLLQVFGVVSDDRMLGYVPRELAARYAPLMDEGVILYAQVDFVEERRVRIHIFKASE